MSEQKTSAGRRYKELIPITLILVLALQLPITGHAAEEYLNNALILEATAGNSEMVETLLDQGADPNAKAQSGWQTGASALFLAARAGHIDCVKVLLAAGADVNAENLYGETPLGVAIRRGHTEVVQILKKAGAKG